MSSELSSHGSRPGLISGEYGSLFIPISSSDEIKISAFVLFMVKSLLGQKKVSVTYQVQYCLLKRHSGLVISCSTKSCKTKSTKVFNRI